MAKLINKDTLFSFTEWSLVSLFLFPALPLHVANVLFIIFCVLVTASCIVKKPVGSSSRIKQNLIISAPFLPYITEFIFHHDNAIAGFELEKKLLFFIAPVILGLYMSLYKLKELRVYAYCFVLALVLLTIYTLSCLLFTNCLFSIDSLANGSRLLRHNFETIAHLHPTYYSLFAATALLWLVYDYKNQTQQMRVFSIVGGAILLFTVLTVAARMPIIALIVSLSWLLFKMLDNKKKLLYSYACIGAIVTILPFIVPSIKSRLDFMNKMDVHDPRYLTRIDERKIIFDCSCNIFLDNFWLGAGNRNAQKLLDNCYTAKDTTTLQANLYNAHNQFLTLGINYGIVIVLLFIVVLLYFIKHTHNNPFAIAFIIATCMVMLTESILERQCGTYFFVLFYLLLLNKEQEGKLAATI